MACKPEHSSDVSQSQSRSSSSSPLLVDIDVRDNSPPTPVVISSATCPIKLNGSSPNNSVSSTTSGSGRLSFVSLKGQSRKGSDEAIVRSSMAAQKTSLLSFSIASILSKSGQEVKMSLLPGGMVNVNGQASGVSGLVSSSQHQLVHSLQNYPRKPTPWYPWASAAASLAANHHHDHDSASSKSTLCFLAIVLYL